MWDEGGTREVRGVLLNSYKVFLGWRSGEAIGGMKTTVMRKVGAMLSAGDFSKLGIEGCSWVSALLIPPSPLSPLSGPEGGDFAQTATASGCLQVLA